MKAEKNICSHTMDNEDDKLISFMKKDLKDKKSLKWNFRRIRFIPATVIENAAHVKQIFLKHNLLTGLPSNLGCLINLTYLCLNGNNIEILPNAIGDINSLQILDVSNNRIKILPVNLTKLSSLKSLNISNNELCDLPEEIIKLESLSILMLSGNKIRILSSSIGKIKSLQGLYLDYNRLITLPTTLADLPLLAHFSCCSNNLSYLPARPFISDPTIFFDNNLRINYIPFSIMPNIKYKDSFDPFVVPSCECFEDEYEINGSTAIQFHQMSTTEYSVCLPNLRKLTFYYRCEKNIMVPPLIELCFRRLSHKNLSHLKKNLCSSMLPASLINILNDGPIAYCDNCKKSNIFIYASIVIINIKITTQISLPGKTIPSVIYFCSDICAHMYYNVIANINNEFGLWLNKSLSQQLKPRMYLVKDLRREYSM